MGKETIVLRELAPSMIERVAGKHGRGRDDAGDGMLVDTLLIAAASWI